jgi:murein L,D-transpeptidase YcbB/YkuD
MARTPLFTLLFFATLTPVSAQSPTPNCGSTLCQLVVSGNLSILRWPDFSAYRTRIQGFYEPAAYALAWVQDGALTPQATAVIDLLKNADAKGLDPEDYDGSRWTDRETRLQSESDLAQFDASLTIAAMRYISDLHFGRANPGLFHTEFDLKDDVDLPSFLRQRLLPSTDVKTVIRGIEPPYEGYNETQQALQQYVALAKEEQPEPLPIPQKPVEPGSQYPAVMQLAQLLRRTGDLPSDWTLPADPNAYTGSLVDAVKHFQGRHGLDQDGRLGKGTVAELNTPMSQRVRQLRLTLERWRWVPHSFPRPPIVVNIPEFQLRALDDTYSTKLAMRVVVGKAYNHQTPAFAGNMKQVVFRPYWNVPPSIQRAELVPKLDRDPTYLAKNNLEVVTQQDTVVTNGAVDAATLAQLHSGKLRIRQTPGPKNSLGLVKFLFPNQYDVYLHDTPATELFSRSRRDFSHGCVRLEKPRDLAAWVLQDQLKWTPDHIAETMNGTDTVTVTLPRPIPVLIVYGTAVIVQNGDVHFFDDIYALDAKLDQELAKAYTEAPAPTSGGRGPRLRE